MPAVTLPVVIAAIVKASLILGVTALAAAALRRSSASARHLVWTLGLVSALAVPALSVVMPRWELPIVRIAAQPAMSITPQTSGGEAGTRRLLPEGASYSARRGLEAETLPPADDRLLRSENGRVPSDGTLLLTIWAIGAAVILGRMLLGLVAVQWMSRRTTVVTDAPWFDQARSLADTLGLSGVRFLRARGQSMPMAWGILRPSVLMPDEADAWPAERLRIVLLHELAHVKRRDCLTHLIAQAACAAYWFHPLAWMAARRLRTERERACDDLVLAAGTRGSDYADQLLNIARVMRSGRFPAVLAGATLAMAHRSQLEGRLIAILDPSVPRRGLTRSRALTATAFFALLIVPVAAVQPWTTEQAAVKGSGEPASQTTGQAAPIESYPGQAAADNRANAARQNVIQDDLQGKVQGAIQGGIAGGIPGGIVGGVIDGVTRGVGEGVTRGIQGGIEGGVEGSTRTHAGKGAGAGVGTGVGVGVENGVANSVVSSVVNGMANGIADSVVRNLGNLGGVEHGVAVEKVQGEHRQRGNAPDPRAIDALMEALKDTDKDVRETAMHALVQFRDPRVFEPLTAALHDPSADIREQAAFGLGQLRDPRAIQPLAAAVKDQNADVREQAVFALGQLRAAAAIDAIQPALHDTADNVREQAAFALGQIRDPRAVDPLVSALKDPKADVRQQAAFALGQIRNAKAVDALVIALKDPVTSVREQAAFALGQIRDPRAIEGLTIALKDASASVRQQAAFALGQIR